MTPADDARSTYAERMDAARARLRAALDPQTEAERVIVDWLGKWDIPTLEPLADMIERGTRNGTASAFDRGYREGTQYRGGASSTATNPGSSPSSHRRELR